MLFNSLEFAAFFVIVTGLYYTLPHRFRWLLLLLASCFFYMAFVPVYILILLLTILIDYFAAIYIDKSEGRRSRNMLVVSIISTCLVLFFFKYFNFFAINYNALAHALGWNYSIEALKWALPIGLSFHTFQSLSYVIEVYRKQQKPEKHFGIYSLYVMFYPQLVAGPIERPQNLLHQFHEEHHFNYAQVRDGLLLMAWGFFKKLIIADRLALYVNYVFANPKDYHGFTLAVALIFFAYQIYCDFSGYSDIARGCAKVMGFDLMRNFDRPYASRSVSEFWRRWHISLSTWFKDYVYIPLGGSRATRSRVYLNLVIVFGISGLWHGANWTFLAWGILNGLYLITELATKGTRERFYNMMNCPGNAFWLATLQIGFTFGLTLLAWTLFRANTFSDALHIWGNMWDLSSRQSVTDGGFKREDWFIAIFGIVLLEAVEYLEQKFRLSKSLFALPTGVRWATYYGIAFLLVLLGVFNKNSFIYFQF